MKGKKSLLLVLFVFIVSFSCFGQNDFKILTRPDVNLEMSFYIPTKTSMRNEGPAYGNTIGVDFYSLKADASVYLTKTSADTVLSFFVQPYTSHFFKLGLDSKYHLYDYWDIFVEHDFLFGQYFTFFYKNHFSFTINTGYDLKITCFRNENITSLIYHTVLIALNFSWNINNFIELYGGASTMGKYDFSLVGTPIYDLGFNFKLKENLTIGFNYEMKMIDMIAVSENISEMMLNLYMRVKL